MKKKKVLSIILIVLLLVVIALNVKNLIVKNKINKNAKVADKIVTDITKNKEMYIVLEINPKVALFIKEGKVTDYRCLNTDCEVLNKDFVGKEIKDAVESIYNDSKEKGFDTTNGVKIKTSEILDLKLSYVVYENLDEEINVVEEKEESLIDKLKKDEDYGEFYTCTEGKTTSCYLNSDIKLGSEVIPLQNYIDGTLTKLRGIDRVLNRFGIETETIYEMGIMEEPAYYIYINGIKFVSAGGETVGTLEYTGTHGCEDHWFKLGDLDLLNPGKIKEKYYNKAYADRESFVREKTSSSKDTRVPLVYEDGDTKYADFDKGYNIYEDTIEIRVCNEETQSPEVVSTITKYFKDQGENKVEISYDEYKNILESIGE